LNSNAGRAISREEAVLVINGWRESRALVKCDCEIAGLAFSMRGRVVEFTAGRRLRFLSDDTFSEFVFDIPSDLACKYADPRGFPEEAAAFVCGLKFNLPSAPDLIAFTEVKEPGR
jgi:hypothetical protein